MLPYLVMTAALAAAVTTIVFLAWMHRADRRRAADAEAAAHQRGLAEGANLRHAQEAARPIRIVRRT